MKIIRHPTAEIAEKVFFTASRRCHCWASLRGTIDRVGNAGGLPFVLLRAFVAEERAYDYNIGHESRSQDL